MSVSVQNLVSLGVTQANASKFTDPLNAALALMDISTKQRQAAFLGQVLVESSFLNELEENLNYSAPRILQVFPGYVKTLAQATALAHNPQALANVVYAGRNGNGNTASGDGWAYRGRGLIGITFKSNYQDAETGTGRPYVAQPDLVSQPSDAALSAAWFWNTHKCNVFADSGRIDLITRAINGPAMLGKDTRATLTQKALSLLST